MTPIEALEIVINPPATQDWKSDCIYQEAIETVRNALKSEEALRKAAAPFANPGKWRGNRLWYNRHGLRCIMTNAQIARDRLFYALNPDAPQYGDPALPFLQDKDR